jgi:hypothetical protein
MRATQILLRCRQTCGICACYVQPLHLGGPMLTLHTCSSGPAQNSRSGVLLKPAALAHSQWCRLQLGR